jgi:fructokinase
MLRIPEGDLDLLSIGETLVDLISVEEVSSLFEAETFRKYQGGSPANIATYVAKLGGSSAVISKTGIGAFGQFLKAELQRASVLTDYLVMDHRVHTSVIFVSRTTGTPDFEAFRDGDFRLEPSEIHEDAIERARVIHASTWPLSRKPARSAVEHAFRLAYEQEKIISLDPNYSPQLWPDYSDAKTTIERMMRYTTITKPSLDDAARLLGEERAPETYIERFHEMGPKIVVLTMGAEGFIISAEGQQTHVPARPVEVADATGAGDSFWAGFLTALLDGNPLKRCGLFAREVVERKLRTVGPLPERIDRDALYAEVDALSPSDT